MQQPNSQIFQQRRGLLLQKASLKCQQRNPGGFLCISKYCKYSSVICQSQNECICQIKHGKCSRTPLTAIILELNRKQLLMKPIIKSIIQQFDRFIKEVIDKQKQIVVRLKNHRYGLNTQETLVQNYILGQNIQTVINGFIVAKVLQNLEQETPKFLIQQEQKYIQQLWEKQSKSFSMFSTSILDFLANPQFNFPRMDTNTISQVKDKNYICSMFKKRIKKFQLLYRASHQNFKIFKFHQKCDGQSDTLLLVRTQADKVIGGFTVLAWDKAGKPKEDKSLQSFLFSVTQQEKYPLHKKAACIVGVPRKGPIFGNYQILIQDQSHKNQSSFFLGTAYKGYEIFQTSQISNQHFSGSQTGKIKVKQWEVFKVHFA